MKKILAFVLAMITVVCLSTAAFAATVYMQPDLTEYLRGLNANIYDVSDVIRYYDMYEEDINYDGNDSDAYDDDIDDGIDDVQDYDDGSLDE